MNNTTLAQTAPDLLTLYGPSLLRVLVVLVILLVAKTMARRSLTALVRRDRISPGIARIINRILFWISSVILLFYALKTAGILDDAWATLTAILALVAIGFFAVWSILSNLLCCFILLITRPFMIGDTIAFMGEATRGKVIDFTLLYTVLQHEDQGVIRIPNNLFFQKAIHVTQGTQQVPLVDQIDRPDSPADPS
ncbi:mechanosensitive ion channel domain-containing protein [Mucisphaera calidilacus]|uniref:Mechanosensitive ion channel n=1 Tax=Mucisphaera calidilacus TaxID=2527982 RepID=A0A518BTY4_9BACT|nr:mechanosensitive ion channel family protein [Mucisphaera calidilacus]QDU70417.1 Mechanosensitive ion channel [Mucisphaera calidilacus]